ncbi:unnamed protein product, partial [Mesocestoides corti]
METSRSLSLWDGSSGLAIQVSVVNSTSVTCPGPVILEVLSNQPLPTNTPLTLQFLSRGLLTTRSATLNADYTCTPHDNDFGHYTCGADGSITCLVGWGGDNCQTPTCPTDSCGVGGLCVGLGQCACKPGWKGESCDICIPREGCRHGVCVNGNDCVCKPGYAGYLCDQAAVTFEELTTSAEGYNGRDEESVSDDSRAHVATNNNTPPRRTVFKHTAKF